MVAPLSASSPRTRLQSALADTGHAALARAHALLARGDRAAAYRQATLALEILSGALGEHHPEVCRAHHAQTLAAAGDAR